MKSESTNWPALLLVGVADLVEQASVRDGLTMLVVSVVTGLIAYGAGNWDWLAMSQGAQRLMWLCAAASLPWSVGILAAKFVWRFDDVGHPMYANWHWGQVVMATIVIVVLAAVGLLGFGVTVRLLDHCTESWNRACRIGQWGYGLAGLLYGIVLMLIVPFVLWWDSFTIRQQKSPNSHPKRPSSRRSGSKGRQQA